MNKNYLFCLLPSSIFFLLAISFTSCRQETGTPLKNLPNPDVQDSAMYYYGQLEAVDYWHQASGDSIMNEQSYRQEYLKGFEKGLKMFKQNNEAYNNGVAEGVQMALRLMRMERNYGIETRKDAVFNGFAVGLKSDSLVNESESRKEFYRIAHQMRKSRVNSDVVFGEVALKKKAGQIKMTEVGKLLWKRVIENGKGVALKAGEVVKIKMHVNGPTGRELSLDFPHQIEVGNRYGSAVIQNAVATMTQGEIAQFATTALALLGEDCQRYKVMPSEVVLFTIEVE